MTTAKICSCCGRHITAAEWDALPSLGTMPSETEAGEPCAVILKNCSCNSTLAVEVVEVPTFVKPRPCVLTAMLNPMATVRV